MKSTEDKIVNKVIEKFQHRSQLGIDKYGTTLHDNGLPTFDWLVHIQEELMDAILYVEKLKQIKLDKVKYDRDYV